MAAYRFRAHLTERSVSPLVGDDGNHICGEISVHRHTLGDGSMLGPIVKAPRDDATGKR